MDYELGKVMKVDAPTYVKDIEANGSFSAGDVVVVNSGKVVQVSAGDTGRLGIAREAGTSGEMVSVLFEGLGIAKKDSGVTINDGERVAGGASGIVSPSGSATYDQIVGYADETDDASDNKIMIKVTE